MRLYVPNTAGLPENLRSELQRIAACFAALAAGPLRVLNVAPERPREGDTAICDGTNWNPLADGIKRPLWFDGSAWQAFL